MKILKQDPLLQKAEDERKKKEEEFQKNKEEYLESLKKNEAFQLYFVQGILKPELNKTTNLEWLYKPSNEDVVSETSNSKLGEMVRRNRIVYRVLKNILNPIVSDWD